MEANAILLAAAASRTVQLTLELVTQLAEAQGNLNMVRKLIHGMNEFSEGDHQMMVADEDKLRSAENSIWDCIESLFTALEPDDEIIEDMTDGDDDDAAKMRAFMMDNRAKFAKKRAEAMEF